MRVISATLAPLPPSSSRMSRPPSSNAYTHLVSVAVAMDISHQTAKAHVRVMFHGLPDRTIYLFERRFRGWRRLRERLGQRIDHEPMGLLAHRERTRLAAWADDSAGRRRERAEVLALAAGGAAGELGNEAGGQQQLQPEGERLGRRRQRGIGIEQCELVAEQVVRRTIRLGCVEEPQDRIAGLGPALDRRAPLAQGRMRVDGVGGRDGAEVAPPLVEDELDAREGLQAATEAGLDLADALCNRADPAPVLGIEMEDTIRLTQTE